jgi:hypothetical protein
VRLAQQLGPEVGAVDELPVVDGLVRVFLAFLLKEGISKVNGELSDVDEGITICHLMSKMRTTIINL